MGNKIIAGKYRTFYPWSAADIKDANMTTTEKETRAAEWNTNYEKEFTYKRWRKRGKPSSTINETTGKRENVTIEKGYEVLGEQLDKLWHDIDNGKLDKNGDFYKDLKAVKDKFAKS